MTSRGYMPVSGSTDWATPAALFDALDREFGPFDLDPCGAREHHYSAYVIHHRGGLFYDGSCPAPGAAGSTSTRPTGGSTRAGSRRRWPRWRRATRTAW